MADLADDDELLFDDDEEQGPTKTPQTATPWNVLIVDDEEDIHRVTRLALSDIRFDDRPLNLLSAFSAEEAKTVMAEQRDIAVILLDVVMEREDAGLDFIGHVRHTLNNKAVRIILRTGQPGQAPERRVVVDYDINDYRTKQDLTAQALFTLMHNSLRSYRDIRALERHRKGLEQIIEASPSLFRSRSVEGLVGGLLEQIAAVLHAGSAVLVDEMHGFAARVDEGALNIVNASGSFADLQGALDLANLPDSTAVALKEAMEQHSTIINDHSFTAVCSDESDLATVLHLDEMSHLEEVEQDLVDVFLRNVSMALQNVRLRQDIEAAQKDMVYMLANALETRSGETGNHVKRVALFCRRLSELMGLDEDEIETVFLAAPLHDIGKIGVPDAILNKPGRLTDEERAVMERHAPLGYRMLSGSRHALLQAGAMIARDHHENWDGTGYPDKRAGEDIHIYGRIAAIADVFDALTSARVYKPAWPYEKVRDFLEEQRGKKFDPKITDLFLAHYQDFVAIRDAHPDAQAQAA